MVVERCACIYCGFPDHRPSDEHIVPEALGGTRTIPGVCERCNNGVLSDIDRELCSRSPLSIVATRELYRPIHHLWDVDWSANGLLIEGAYDQKADGFHPYPQMIFDDPRRHLRAELGELQSAGSERFQRVFVTHLARAFHAYEAGNKRRLIVERVRSPFIRGGLRFPPRVFTRRRVDQLDGKETFILRYIDPADKRRALKELAELRPDKRFRQFEIVSGSRTPKIQVVFEQVKVVRALMKLAVNLLIDSCRRTTLNRKTIEPVIRFILGELAPPPGLLLSNGFVLPASVEVMGAHSQSHRFWLIHHGGEWTAVSSFFGGRVFASVRFPGPNREAWNFLEIEVPLDDDKSNWSRKDRIVTPYVRLSIEWEDAGRLIPSVPLTNFQSMVVTETRQLKRPPSNNADQAAQSGRR